MFGIGWTLDRDSPGLLFLKNPPASQRVSLLRFQVNPKLNDPS
jgi:hypothetical protein